MWLLGLDGSIKAICHLYPWQYEGRSSGCNRSYGKQEAYSYIVSLTVDVLHSPHAGGITLKCIYQVYIGPCKRLE